MTARILSEEPLDEIIIKGTTPSFPIQIPIKVRLSITAQADGYKNGSNIFEYVEDGKEKTIELKLEK